MTQERIYDFGALLTQGRAKAITGGLFTAGLYGGFEPTIVSSTEISLSPGTCLLPNGVLVKESAPTTITVPTPATATDYTVTVDHDDIQAIGGSPAYYTVRPGILARSGSPNANSTALLWIRHPGLSGLTSSMLSRPPTLQAGSLLAAIEGGLIQAPFPNACDVSAGANIVATASSHSSGPHILGLKVVNTALVGLQTYSFRLPLPPRPTPRQIQLFADIPSLGSISLTTAPYELYVADGSTITPSPASVSGPVTALDFLGSPAATFALPAYAQDNPPVSLGMTVTVPPATLGVFVRGLNLIGD